MKIHKGLELELDIVDLAFGGEGIAKLQSVTTTDSKPLVILVDGALPGQRVRAKITLKKRRHAKAKVLEVLQRSPDELTLDYQPTPGAPWLHLPIEKQQVYKRKQVFSLFTQLAGIDLESCFGGLINSLESWCYRNKMDYSFGPTTEIFDEESETWQHSGFGLGSKKRGQFWLVENLEKPSGLFDSDFEQCLPEFRVWCESQVRSVYNARMNQGFWRQLVVRKSFYQQRFSLNLITNNPVDFGINEAVLAQDLINWWQQKNINVSEIFWTQSNDVGNGAVKFSKRLELISEGEFIERLFPESEESLDFQISPDSFFQTNVGSAEKLYQKIADLVGESDEILELCAGTGTISQVLARLNPGSKITSVEIVEQAVKDAQANAKRNGFDSIDFRAADVKDFMKTYQGEVPTVVVDPPRAGLSPKIWQKIVELAPQKIVYVSCNPSTMARDADFLKKASYDLGAFWLVDQFPHTAHVECVGMWNKKI